MATQVLVIFVIRTRGRPWASLPSPWLAATSVAIVAIAAALPLTPLGRHLGFVAPPWQFYALVAALTAVYLVAVEAVKRRFFRRHAPV